jgi:protein-disulfide isomerase
VTRPIRFAAALFAGILLPAAAFAEILSTEEALTERVIGNSEAPITIIEYASLTCPHCASFHAETLPRIKKDWIETGKAKLIYRDYPLDKYAASGAMIARCAPKDKYFVFLNAFYAQQKNWSSAPDPVKVLTQLAGLGGMSKDDVDACLANDALQDGILQMRLEGQMEYDINSTPSFVINGKKVTNLPYDDFNDLLEDAAK